MDGDSQMASLLAQRLKRLPPTRETRVRSLGREDPLGKEMATHSSTLAWRIPWRKDRLPNPVFLGFPGGSDSTESACNAGDLRLIPGSGRSPGEGNGNPLQYSCLENPRDGGAWWGAVYGVAKSRARLSN